MVQYQQFCMVQHNKFEDKVQSNKSQDLYIIGKIKYLKLDRLCFHTFTPNYFLNKTKNQEIKLWLKCYILLMANKNVHILKNDKQTSEYYYGADEGKEGR